MSFENLTQNSFFVTLLLTLNAVKANINATPRRPTFSIFIFDSGKSNMVTVLWITILQDIRKIFNNLIQTCEKIKRITQ